MKEPRYQYKVLGDDTTYYSSVPVKPGDIISGKQVAWVGNHGGSRKRNHEVCNKNVVTNPNSPW